MLLIFEDDSVAQYPNYEHYQFDFFLFLADATFGGKHLRS